MNPPSENPYQSPMASPGEIPATRDAMVPAIIAGVTAFVAAYSLLCGIGGVCVVFFFPPNLYGAGSTVLGLTGLLAGAVALLVARHVYRQRQRTNERLVRLYQRREAMKQELHAQRGDAVGHG